MVSKIISGIAVTLTFLWLASGPHFEGFNLYTGLAFLCGMMAGCSCTFLVIAHILGHGKAAGGGL